MMFGFCHSFHTGNKKFQGSVIRFIHPCIKKFATVCLIWDRKISYLFSCFTNTFIPSYDRDMVELATNDPADGL